MALNSYKIYECNQFIRNLHALQLEHYISQELSWNEILYKEKSFIWLQSWKSNYKFNEK